MVKIAVMGFGTVGSGVYEIIAGKDFAKKAGEDIDVKYILDIRDFPGHAAEPLLTKEFADILNDPEVGVVAEVMGGLHPAYEFTKELLENGKNVVTSNKELVATYGPELLETARNHGVNYLFEASVGGGIPIIRPMSTCLLANHITRIVGILNGTTNYILSEMIHKGKDFSEALQDAQEKGYAERNPAADVEGHDACRKIAILASLAWGRFVDYNNITTEGICDISLEDVKYADMYNSVIKLIGYADIDNENRIFARVSPMVISREYLISGVNDVFNAISINGDALGEAMFYGPGAGKLPTASAVVADVIDCVKHLHKTKHNMMVWKRLSDHDMVPAAEKTVSFMVRTTASREDILKEFENAQWIEAGIAGETGFVTPAAPEGVLNGKLDNIGGVISKIRVLGKI